MALDATIGGASANSYATLAAFKAYADLIGYDYSAKIDAALEIALIKGAQYLERAYRGLWIGDRHTEAQALAWPRSGRNGETLCDVDGWTIQTDGIPTGVIEAQYEAAILSLGGTDLTPALERGGAVKRERVKAGPVESETEYADGASSRDRFTALEGLLSGLVTSQPGASAVSVENVR